MSWKDLDIKLKAELIKLGVLSGIRDIKLIRLLYDGINTPTLVGDLSYNETNVRPLLGIERIKLEYGIPEEEVNKANDIIQLIENEINLEEINNQLPVLFRLFKNGGYKDNPPFILRILNNDRRSVKDWQNNNYQSTHKLSYALIPEGYIVYPEVLEVNGLLHDFTDPKYKHGKWDALDNAIRNNDTLRFSTEQLALKYTQEYKQKYHEYFKLFNKGGYISNNPTLALVGKVKKYNKGGYEEDEKNTIYTAGYSEPITIIAKKELSKRQQMQADEEWREYLKQHPIQIGSEEYNRLPERAKAQVYKNSVTNAINKAALPAAAAIIAPTLLTSVGANVLPAVGNAIGTVLANPFVDAALTVHGAVAAPENVKQGIQQIKNGEYWGGAFNLGLTALDLIGAGLLIGRTARILNPAYRSKHAYNAIAPVGYDGTYKRFKNWAHNMWYNTDIDLKNPEWLEKLRKDNNYERPLLGYTGIGDYIHPSVLNRGKIADEARLDAWALYNNLPQQYGTYIKNTDGSYSYNMSKIMLDSKGAFSIPNLDGFAGSTYRDFVTGAGGNVGISGVKQVVEVFPEKQVGKIFLEDIWDLHPFSRSTDRFFGNRLNAALKKSIGTKKTEKITDNIIDFITTNKLAKKIDDKLTLFELSKVSGGRPFTMKTTIPFTKTTNIDFENPGIHTTYKYGLDSDNIVHLPKSKDEIFLFDNLSDLNNNPITNRKLFNSDIEYYIFPNLAFSHKFDEGGYSNLSTTPTMEDKPKVIQRGTVRWNPFNVFNRNYKGAPIYESENFGDSFRLARIDEAPIFIWNGKAYNTNLKPNPLVEAARSWDTQGDLRKIEFQKKIISDPEGTMEYFRKTFPKGEYKTMNSNWDKDIYIIDDMYKNGSLGMPNNVIVKGARYDIGNLLWDYLNTTNLTYNQKLALMANSYKESMGWTTTKQNNGPARGYYQMENVLFKNYQDWLKQNKLKDNITNETKYIIDLFENHRDKLITPISANLSIEDVINNYKDAEEAQANNHRSAYVHRGYYTEDALRDWDEGDLDAAVKAMEALFEKAGKPRLEDRQKIAWLLSEMYK